MLLPRFKQDGSVDDITLNTSHALAIISPPDYGGDHYSPLLENVASTSIFPEKLPPRLQEKMGRPSDQITWFELESEIYYQLFYMYRYVLYLNGIRAVFLNVYLKTQMKGFVNTANTSKKDLQNQWKKKGGKMSYTLRVKLFFGTLLSKVQNVSPNFSVIIQSVLHGRTVQHRLRHSLP